ncbi:MAG: ABC transporter permease [Tannerellaceae bacterium]|jgi:ABC-type lipoprotein release transport system permease subunit|nr:ABC transporter permease [Tannerellaceae bacterium]
MNTHLLLRANRLHYRRFYRLIALAALILTAVIVGSLMVGRSVRATLVNRVEERLGKDTETIVYARQTFFDHALADHPLFQGRARGMLYSPGFVSVASRLIPVAVWGVNSPFIPPGEARANPALADELPLAAGNVLVLRLPRTSLVPSGSLFVTENYTTGLRLNLREEISAEEGGNLSLKNEQVLPLNLFVNREALASALEVEGKINLVFSPARIRMTDLAEAWTPERSGLRISRRKGFPEVTAEGVFLPREVVETLRSNHPGANRLFSYLANRLAAKDHSLAYSFVTALDHYRGKPLREGEILLSDYAAQRLKVALGDSLQITCYRSEDLKTLREDTLRLRVAGILPLQELAADPSLSADFPGLTDVERCTDWDSDLPIDLGAITPEDERYWATYRATPKALLPYETFAPYWSNAYGSATGLRMDTEEVNPEGLQPAMFGLQIRYPREAGLEAAQNGVDFSFLFLSLGVFIILSAIFLMLVPLSEMMHYRQGETDLLRALGYTGKHLAKLLRQEAAPLILCSCMAGAVVGLLYTRLVLTLLGSLWKGATHTGGFLLIPDLGTLLGGSAVGFLIAWIWLCVAIQRAVRQPLVRQESRNRRRAWLSFVTLTSGVVIVFSVGLNRRGFTDRSQLREGTGGYALWCESNLPLYHNLRTPQGRSKLALEALPPKAEALQLLRYGADDASCLNLNRVSQPTVLGVEMEALRESDFRIQRSLYPAESVFDALQTPGDSVYPALIDETVLTWGLKRKLGDTLRYERANGQSLYLQLTGTLANSVFQGNVLVDKKLFSDIWGEITGSEVLLLKVEEAETEEARQLLSQALSEYGVRVTTTARRLKEFNSVTDTYLTIFLTLGGLGLLLGMMSLVIVIRKDLASRREEIRLYRSLGFPEEKIAGILSAENRRVPLCAILTGLIASLGGVSGGIRHVSLWTGFTAGVLALCLVCGTLFFVHQSVKKCLSAE